MHLYKNMGHLSYSFYNLISLPQNTIMSFPAWRSVQYQIFLPHESCFKCQVIPDTLGCTVYSSSIPNVMQLHPNFPRLTCAFGSTEAAKPDSWGNISMQALAVIWVTFTHRKSQINFSKTTFMIKDYSQEDCLPAEAEVLIQSILPQNILSLNTY